MFSHIMVGSNDIARSKKFYDALFVAIGAQPGAEVASGRLRYSTMGSASQTEGNRADEGGQANERFSA
jgi:hypothetical protein